MMVFANVDIFERGCWCVAHLIRVYTHYTCKYRFLDSCRCSISQSRSLEAEVGVSAAETNYL